MEVFKFNMLSKMKNVIALSTFKLSKDCKSIFIKYNLRAVTKTIHNIHIILTYAINI
jgi:hypothetical protein